MFKRLKESEWYRLFNDVWSNERTRSMIILAFWLLFFVVLVLFARGSSSSDTSADERFGFDAIDNYSFCAISDDLEVNGLVYDDKMEFVLNNHRYYVSDDVYLISGDRAVKYDFDLSFLKIDADFLGKLVTGINGNKMDGYTQYLVSLDRFISLYDNVNDDLSLATSYNVIVNVYEDDGVISKVILDLSNYRSFYKVDKSFVVTIYFYNVNNVFDFSKEYEEMGGIE